MTGEETPLIDLRDPREVGRRLAAIYERLRNEPFVSREIKAWFGDAAHALLADRAPSVEDDDLRSRLAAVRALAAGPTAPGHRTYAADLFGEGVEFVVRLDDLRAVIDGEVQ